MKLCKLAGLDKVVASSVSYGFAGVGLSWCTDALIWFELTDVLLEATKQKCPLADDVTRRFLSIKES